MLRYSITALWPPVRKSQFRAPLYDTPKQEHVLMIRRTPYVVDGLLHLQLVHATVRAEILQLFKPFTLSCAMLVRIKNHAEIPAVVVLKA